MALFISHISCGNKRDRQFLTINNIPEFNMLLSDSITKYNSNKISLGAPTLLIYFSPDCEHCHKETKDILKNIGLLNKVQIIMLTPLSSRELYDFYNYYQLWRYRNIIVGRDYQFEFANIFHPSTIPYLAIYNKEKKLVKIYKGETEINSILKAVSS